MKQILLFILLTSIAEASLSQPSDFIVLKKRNNRTLKTYYPGAFISALTYNGFTINGFIKEIRNDSVIILQQQRQLVGTEFGTTVDTVSYIMGVDYHEIKTFHYTSQYTWGRKRGFVEVTLPRLMKYGGIGFIVLELVNTAYRKESISEDNKMVSLAIAAGVAATGFAITYFQNKADKAGGKYKVVYVKNSK
ncbi:hypothetical protein A4H97_00890 [Niastella yeongjuensis]|uniref:Uncharacterized protein n=1 Tax=Niastella yeongjuensis TaxID=354355 RepID=A0A1V9EWA4_9BACT|nr:hypothetical protein [Niastella yeongjuensis]OQP50429.1 hypothetical protein A4H97_00890 [Niastella yeongjuensis]SEN34866.1 hypothetical protein SAMN05660816_00771 [Niastella yeongjuensis]